MDSSAPSTHRHELTDDDLNERTRLGRDVGRRLRRPGMPAGHQRPARLGSIASAVTRFAASTSRPVTMRRALQGPASVAVPTSSASEVAPPRWWTPTHTEHADSTGVDELPARGLPRAVRRVPNQETWTPGGIATGMRPDIVNVRRPAAVTAAGPMLMQQDKARLTPRQGPVQSPAAGSTGSADPPSGRPSG
ncbi:MAG: hypothetical protein ABI345_14085, partial [Jatrophihabitans sp.]